MAGFGLPPPVPTGSTNLWGDKVVTPNMFRVGDWLCPLCRHHNYKDKFHCNRCGQPKPLKESSTVPTVTPGAHPLVGIVPAIMQSPPAPEGDWHCPCGFTNQEKYKNVRCFRCGSMAPKECYTNRGQAAAPPPPRESIAPDTNWTCECGFINQAQYKNERCYRCGQDIPKHLRRKPGQKAPAQQAPKKKKKKKKKKESSDEEDSDEDEDDRRKRPGSGVPLDDMDVFGDHVHSSAATGAPTPAAMAAMGGTNPGEPPKKRTMLGSLPPWEVQRRVKELAAQMLEKELEAKSHVPTEAEKIRQQEQDDAARILAELEQQAKRKKRKAQGALNTAKRAREAAAGVVAQAQGGAAAAPSAAAAPATASDAAPAAEDGTPPASPAPEAEAEEAAEC